MLTAQSSAGPSSRIVAGLDIGSSKVCVAVARVGRDREPEILGIGQSASKGVRRGEIVEPEAVKEGVIQALNEAEERADVVLRSVVLAVTGLDIAGTNHHQAGPADGFDADACLPPEQVALHAIPQDSREDASQDGRDFHVVRGVRSRIKAYVQCAVEAGVQVENLVFNGIASANALLDAELKRRGVLLLDIGAGTTDYVLYDDGALRLSGSAGIGGDFIDQDPGLQWHLSKAEGERLKRATAGEIASRLPPDEAALRDEIMALRLRELFELVKSKMAGARFFAQAEACVCLTGGTSRLPGIGKLATEVFGKPARGVQPRLLPGTGLTAQPELSTVIGLLV